MNLPLALQARALVRRFLYTLYTRRLERRVRGGLIPNHVAVILDGNRRYARKVGLKDLSQGYYLGFLKARELVQWCDELRIPVLTFWILSADNLRREEADLTSLFDVIQEHVTDLASPAGPHSIQRRIQAIGQLDLVPQSVREAILNAEERTKGNKGFYLNVAVAYGGREEIVEAVHRFLSERYKQGNSTDDVLRSLSIEEIAKHTYTAYLPDPDLIIRTSGETRLSGFLLWQSVYSEFYFCDAYWPEFRKLDLLRAIRSYQQRTRRFGK